MCVRRLALNDGALAVFRLDILKHNTYFAKLIKFKCHIKREVRKGKTEASFGGQKQTRKWETIEELKYNIKY